LSTFSAVNLTWTAWM